MEFQQLRYFLAIAQTGSFTAAAKSCRVSQPSLSSQLAKLEADLGGPLFERGRKGARLTERGERFLPRTNEALRSLELGRQELEDLSGLKGGHVRLGCLPTTGAFLLPPLLTAFRRAHPAIRVELKEGSSPVLRQQLSEGGVDLAIVDEAGLHEKLSKRLLFKEALVVALPPSHHWAGRRAVHLEQLKSESWVMMKPGHGFRAIVDAALARAGLLPEVVFESDEIATVQALVAAGSGISLVPEMVRRPGIAYVPVAGAALTRSLFLEWRQVHLSSAAEALRKTAFQMLEKP